TCRGSPSAESSCSLRMPTRPGRSDGACQGTATRLSPTKSSSLERLFIITDTAGQLTDPRYEADFRERRRGGTRLWKQIGSHLGDFTLLPRGVDRDTKRVTVGIFQGSNVRASWNSL